MQQITQKHISLALEADPEVDTRTKKKVLDLLAGKNPKRRLISTKEACEILGCHAITLRRIEKKGYLKAIRFSARRLRWDLDAVELYATNGISESEVAR